MLCHCSSNLTHKIFFKPLQPLSNFTQYVLESTHSNWSMNSVVKKQIFPEHPLFAVYCVWPVINAKNNKEMLTLTKELKNIYLARIKCTHEIVNYNKNERDISQSIYRNVHWEFPFESWEAPSPWPNVASSLPPWHQYCSSQGPTHPRQTPRHHSGPSFSTDASLSFLHLEI